MTSYNFTSAWFNVIQEIKQANRKPTKTVCVSFSLLCFIIFVLFPVEKTTDFNSSQPEIRVQLAVHIDVDPKVGTDGGCFGLIAALTLGTAAGETGSHWSWAKQWGVLGILWSKIWYHYAFNFTSLYNMYIHLYLYIIFIYYIKDYRQRKWKGSHLFPGCCFPGSKKSNHEIWRCSL